MDKATEVELTESLEQILSDSMDVDWTCSTGAAAIVAKIKAASNGGQFAQDCLAWLQEALS